MEALDAESWADTVAAAVESEAFTLLASALMLKMESSERLERTGPAAASSGAITSLLSWA